MSTERRKVSNRPQRSDDPIKNGSKCPYCDGPTNYVDSKIIYGKSYGMIYLCRPCNAYCGVHKGTNISLGRLANQSLREEKKEAHKYFNMIYEGGHMTRHEAYDWLCGMLEIPKDETHIGMFDEKMCKDTIYYAKQFLNDMRRLDLDLGAKPTTEYFELS